MEDITDQVMAMDKALSSALMDTECSDPIVAVISLSKILCELLVELGMDDDEQATAAFRDTLRNIRNEHTDKGVH
mgnify:FL=1|jgi:hypothetical protein